MTSMTKIALELAECKDIWNITATIYVHLFLLLPCLFHMLPRESTLTSLVKLNGCRYNIPFCLLFTEASDSYNLFTPYIVNKRILLKTLNGIEPVRNRLSPNYADGNITLWVSTSSFPVPSQLVPNLLTICPCWYCWFD